MPAGSLHITHNIGGSLGLSLRDWHLQFSFFAVELTGGHLCSAVLHHVPQSGHLIASYDI